MISLSQVQDVEVRDNASLLGKIISQNILFLCCNLFSFSTIIIGKFTTVISFIFFRWQLTQPQPTPWMLPKLLQSLLQRHLLHLVRINFTYKLKKKNRKMFSFHALTLYRSPMSIRLMFIHVRTVVVVSQSQYDCDFETNYCSWKQDMSDVFNWTRAQGPTGSVNTGPTNDHTKQNRKLRLCLTRSRNFSLI